MELVLRGDGALIAITEGSGERFVAGVEADVVDSPAIDGNGADAFGCEFGSAAQSIVDEMADRGPIRLAEVQDAQKEILAIARRLAAEGTINLGGKDDDYV